MVSPTTDRPEGFLKARCNHTGPLAFWAAGFGLRVPLRPSGPGIG